MRLPMWRYRSSLTDLHRKKPLIIFFFINQAIPLLNAEFFRIFSTPPGSLFLCSSLLPPSAFCSWLLAVGSSWIGGKRAGGRAGGTPSRNSAQSALVLFGLARSIRRPPMPIAIAGNSLAAVAFRLVSLSVFLRLPSTPPPLRSSSPAISLPSCTRASWS